MQGVPHSVVTNRHSGHGRCGDRLSLPFLWQVNFPKMSQSTLDSSRLSAELDGQLVDGESLSMQVDQLLLLFRGPRGVSFRVAFFNL
jgi:hypothetical protein